MNLQGFGLVTFKHVTQPKISLGLLKMFITA